MRKTIFSITIFCIFQFVEIAAATSKWLNYTDMSEIRSMVEDDKYIWIATNGGLASVSKSASTISIFTKANSGLPSNNLKSLSVDHENNLWLVPSTGGLVKYDGYTWEIFNSQNSALPSNQINDLAFDSENHIWLATVNSGVVRYDGSEWKIMTSDFNIENINIIKIDINDKVWIAIQEKGIATFANDAWIFYRTGNSQIPSDFVTDIEFDSQNSAWIGADALVKIENENWTIYDRSNSEIPGTVTSLDIDSKDVIWVGTKYGLGIGKFDGINWTNYNIFNSPLLNHFISYIFAAKNDNIWVLEGNSMGKVRFYRIKENNWEQMHISNSALEHNKVSSIVVDKKNQKWVGSRGLIKFTGQTSYFYSPLNRTEQVEDFIHSLRLDFNDNLWIGIWDNGSLVKMQDEKFTSYSPNPGGEITDIDIDLNNNVWVTYQQRYASGTAFGGGLGGFDGSTWSVFTKSNSELNTNNLLSFAIDANNALWIASGSRNINIYDSESWAILEAPHDVYYISIDKKNQKWLATSDGLFIYNDSAYMELENSSSPLSGQHIRTMTFGKNDIIWFGTSNGGAISYDSNNWTVYNSHNSALPSDKVSTIAIDSLGNKWFGTDAGIAVFNESGIIIDNIEQNLGVTNFRLHQNYPNPFNPQTTIEFDVKEQTHVQLNIYDVLGRQVYILANSVYPAGTHKLVFNAQNLPTGVYFYKIQMGDYSEVRKMLLLE